MASFRPHQGIDSQSLHLLDDAPGHNLHGRIITGKIPPAGAFPVLGRNSPAFAGCVKYFPPVLQVFRMGIHQFVVDGGQDVGALLIYCDIKSFKTGLFGNLFGDILQNENKIFLWQARDKA